MDFARYGWFPESLPSEDISDSTVDDQVKQEEMVGNAANNQQS